MQHPPLLDVFPLCEPFLKRGCTREACSYTHAVICDEAVLDRLREKPWLLCSQWAFGTCTTVPCPRGKVHPAELAVVRPARVVPPTPPKQSSAAKAKERDNSAGGHFSWTAMDYLAMDLKGLNARNAYLNALLHGELATSVGARLLALAREEACCRQFVNHKTLKKELSEALSALRLVALALEKMDQRGPSGGNPLEAGRSNTGSSNTSSSAQEPGSVASVIVCPDCTAGGNVGTMVGDSVSFTGLEHSDGGSGGGGGGGGGAKQNGLPSPYLDSTPEAVDHLKGIRKAAQANSIVIGLLFKTEAASLSALPNTEEESTASTKPPKKAPTGTHQKVTKELVLDYSANALFPVLKFAVSARPRQPPTS
mmetsp:Transcript_44950/g.88430  ORF Transcript_44950/g.88430 Transcript_44950/m.88430 type:complete len:367 (+) Transcript_44950:89-1189(+)